MQPWHEIHVVLPQINVKPGFYYIGISNDNRTGPYNFSVKVPQMLPKAPSVSKVTPKSKAVKGTTYKNSTVKVKIGSKIYTTKRSSKGKFSVKNPAQKAKKAIYVSVTTPAGTSASKKVIVK
ncbi:Ig-like domain-containing protein [Kurthia gibsonii]|uniref:Ig-like domain-containing protein n=1 Tax=Kurthia gibsonii TaxID=33946 RepID=UPI0030D07D73